ncbi:Gfo/Idh/MocA family protein [candidate division KSB1 bacterium]
MGAAAALSTAGALGAGSLMSACNGGANVSELNLPPLLDQAPDGKELKAGLVGCGGRGKGAMINFLDSGPNLKIVALADVFQDRIDQARKVLKEQKGLEVADEKCFLGFDAYQKLIDSGVDLVIIATPPHFRPDHFAACINARKHVFMEKPVAVDPVGARSIMSTAKKAEGLNLCVVTGTQRRHKRDYIETYKKIKSGEIGDIVSANCYWNQSQLWFKNHEQGWSDMEYMIRDWVNWCWLSGDHIVEQHVHNLDVIHWFTGMHPVKAVGFGARHRRVTGDQYDMFSVDFVYENGMHVHSMCRQIDGCIDNVSEFVMGTKGYSNCENTIWKKDGTKAWEYEYPKNEDDEPTKRVKVDPYVQEHIDLVTCIRTNQPINEAENTAISTLTAIMGRISAYTGKEVTWEEMMSSDLRLGPTEYKLGPVDIKAVIPVPGTGKTG